MDINNISLEQVQAIERVGKAFRMYGDAEGVNYDSEVGHQFENECFSAYLEGVIHEVTHIATIELLLEYSIEMSALEGIVWERGISGFSYKMTRVYRELYRELHFISEKKLSEDMEIYAAAATYMILNRWGLANNPAIRFEEARAGDNEYIADFVDRCTLALTENQTEMVANWTVQALPRVVEFLNKQLG